MSFCHKVLNNNAITSDYWRSSLHVQMLKEYFFELPVRFGGLGVANYTCSLRVVNKEVLLTPDIMVREM